MGLGGSGGPKAKFSRVFAGDRVLIFSSKVSGKQIPNDLENQLGFPSCSLIKGQIPRRSGKGDIVSTVKGGSGLLVWVQVYIGISSGYRMNFKSLRSGRWIWRWRWRCLHFEF